MVAGFGWTAEPDTIRLRFKEITTSTVAQAVRDRLLHGCELLLDGIGTRVVLRSAGVFAIRESGDGLLELDLPAVAVAGLLDALVPGTHAVPETSYLIVEVVPPA
jgi:hypothetical protein